jgi:hypothetical protein
MVFNAIWSWSYGSWIYDYISNQCQSLLSLWVRIPLRRCVLDMSKLCDKVYQWLAACRSFSPGTLDIGSRRFSAKVKCVEQTFTKVAYIFNVIRTKQLKRTKCWIVSIVMTYGTVSFNALRLIHCNRHGLDV